MELVQLPELREATSGTLKVERESARERERESDTAILAQGRECSKCRPVSRHCKPGGGLREATAQGTCLGSCAAIQEDGQVCSSTLLVRPRADRRILKVRSCSATAARRAGDTVHCFNKGLCEPTHKL